MNQKYFIPTNGAMVKVFFIFLGVLYLLGFIGGGIVFHIFTPDASLWDLPLKVPIKEQTMMIIKVFPAFALLSIVCSFFVLINIIQVNNEGVRAKNVFTKDTFLNWNSLVAMKQKKLPGIGLEYLIIYSEHSSEKIWLPLFLKDANHIVRVVSEKIKENLEM